MKAHVLAYGLTVPILLVSLACQKPDKPQEPASSDSKVLPTASAADRTAMAASSGGSTVEIAFNGAIVHLLPSGEAQKSAALNIADHQFVVEIPPVQDENILIKNFPGSVRCTKKRGCELSGLKKGVTFRVVGENDSDLQPSPVVKDRTFVELVPGLKALSTPQIATTADLDPELRTDVPDQGTKFTAFWDLSGGTFSATPFCGRSAFKTASGTQPSRKFAETVRLVANTEANTTAVLEYRTADKGAWEKVSFVNGDYVYIHVSNDPNEPLTDHFVHHAMIAKDTTCTLPTIDHAEDCKEKGLMIGCANTNWP